MWSYSQTTGELKSPAGSCVGCGYSGHGAGLNNPAMQDVEGVGPIPRGAWTIGAFFDDDAPAVPDGKPHKGPMVAHLTPAAETETFGRVGFMVHGDNEKMNHTASEGCIILARTLRAMMMSSSDKALMVVE